MVASGLQLYTNNIFTGGLSYSVSARPRWFMLTTRVGGSGASIHCFDFWPYARELLIDNPPPRTPNFPATDGTARTAAAALPPLRLRSRPQPHRTTAGDELT